MEHRVKAGLCELSNKFGDDSLGLFCLLTRLNQFSKDDLSKLFGVLDEVQAIDRRTLHNLRDQDRSKMTNLLDLLVRRQIQHFDDDDGVETEESDDDEEESDDDVDGDEGDDGDDGDDGDERSVFVHVDNDGFFCFCTFCGIDKSCAVCRGEEKPMAFDKNLNRLQQKDYCRGCQLHLFGKSTIDAEEACECYEKKKLPCGNCIHYGNKYFSVSEEKCCKFFGE